jgi:RNA polymerase sigma factor (TIGR02999 family)
MGEALAFWSGSEYNQQLSRLRVDKTRWLTRFNTHGRNRSQNPLWESGEDETRRRLSLPVMPMNDVTRILSAVEQGDPHAAEALLPLVYDELRKLAAQKMAQESPGQTLQATALVHDAYLRLVDAQKVQHWNGRGHFFAAAAEAMRRILVDNARRKVRPKHGGERVRIDFDAVEIASPEISDELLTLDDALTQLAAADPPAAQLVTLRYFAGLTIKEAAKVLGISPRATDLLWAYARAWLLKKIQGHAPLEPPADNSTNP